MDTGETMISKADGGKIDTVTGRDQAKKVEARKRTSGSPENRILL